jgi:hypothetical protein
VEISADGTASGERISGAMTLDGGFGGWREGPIDAMFVVDGPAAPRLARQLLSETSDKSEGQAPSGGRAILKAVGTPSKGLLSLIKLDSDAVNLAVHGRSVFAADAAIDFSGDLDIASQDVTSALALAGLRGPPAAGKLALRGSAQITTTDRGVRISPQSLTIGDSRISGNIVVDGPAIARRIDANLRSSEVHLPALAGLLLSNRDKAVASAEGGGFSEALDWRERPFDLSKLERFNGHVLLSADTATFQDGSAVSDMTLDASLEPGRVTVTKLTGRVAGGTISSALKLEKAPGGAALSGTFTLADIALDKLGPGGKPGAAGRAQVNLHVAAQGVSPQGILGTLAGRGELELKSARIEHLSPDVVDSVAESVLSGRAENGSEAIKKALKAEIGAGGLTIGSRKLPIEVSDGVAKLHAVTLDLQDARLTNDTAVEISSLKMDSEWRIEPKQSHARAGGGKGALPGISVLYVGPLAALGTIEPRINSDSLERELTVRRMERDVEQLERLRREDEARAKLEAERAKSLEPAQKQVPQVIEAPFPFPGGPAVSGSGPSKVTIEPLPPPLPPSAAGTGGPPSVPPRAAPTQPSWRDQVGRGDRSGT